MSIVWELWILPIPISRFAEQPFLHPSADPGALQGIHGEILVLNNMLA
jgi:hypothetical protein